MMISGTLRKCMPLGLKTATKGVTLLLYRNLSLKSFDNKYISVQINNDDVVQYSNVFLRDACGSPESVDYHSLQKLFTTGSICKGLEIKSKPEIIKDPETSEECLKVVWSQDGKDHESRYTNSFLNHYASRSSRLEGRNFFHDRVIWDGRIMGKDIETLHFDCRDYLNDTNSFFEATKKVNDYGMVFVDNIPDPSQSVGDTMTEENYSQWPVAHIAQRFGYIKRTFYGTLFDVKNVKDAKNIAYTNSFLPLHMDLLYYESPPGLQLLHAIKNSTLGGENIFCDSFLAAKHIRETDPSAFLALTQIPITYQYDNDHEFYHYQRPLIVEDDIIDSRSNYPFIREVNYSPPFQGPFELGITKSNSGGASNSVLENANHFLFNDFLRGIRLFEDFINDPKNHFNVRLDEGTCVIFDNRRVLHSRLKYSDSNGGDRWLMGCYVDGDSFRSKLRVRHKNIH